MVSVALGWTDITEEADIDSVLAATSENALDSTASLAFCSSGAEVGSAAVDEVSRAPVVVDCSAEFALSLAADVE